MSAEERLRNAVRDFFESLRSPVASPARSSPEYAELVDAATTAKSGTYWGEHACRQLQMVDDCSILVRQPDGSTTEHPGDGPWTLELDHTRINAIEGDMSFPCEIDATYERLYWIFCGYRRYYHLGNSEEEEFYLWLREQYQAWCEVAENCSRPAGEAVSYEELSLPFFFPWMRFDGDACAAIVRNVARRVLGDEASMLTVIEDGDATPLVFYERVKDGLFTLARLYKGETLPQVRELLCEAELPVAYTKRATIDCLRDIWRAERAFLVDGQRAIHTAAVMKAFLEDRPSSDEEAETAPEDDTATQQMTPPEPVRLEGAEGIGVTSNLVIEPMPAALVGALCALQDVDLRRESEDQDDGQNEEESAEEVEEAQEGGDGETEEAGLPLSALLPNVWIKTGDRKLHIDLGAEFDVIVSESLVLETTDALANVRSLRDAWRSLAHVIAREMPRGGLEFGVPGLIGSIVRFGTRQLRREAPGMLRTMRWTMALLGSPLQFVLQSGSTGVLVNFLDGDLAGVELLEMKPNEPLAAEWLKLCRDRSIGFVHFIFRIERLSGIKAGDWVWGDVEPGQYNAPPTIMISPQRRLQYYPDNAIADAIGRHFLGLGMVNLIDLLPDLFET